ncbi:MAG: hypothetical protein U9Q19_02580 [Pseudomonadota bacterium]|nr:hypothetical protein [Pseudomonadota bacterium]
MDAVNNAAKQLTPEEQAKMQQEMQQATGMWLTMVVRGITMRPPVDIKAHGHGPRLYIRAKFYKKDRELSGNERADIDVSNLPEEEFEYEEMILNECHNLTFTPATSAHPADFMGEWPPQTMMDEQTKPKIVKPSAEQVEKILKQNKDKALQ